MHDACLVFTLPSLRARRVDLGLLVAALISAGKLGPPRVLRMQGDAARLVRHDWPIAASSVRLETSSIVRFTQGRR